MREERLEGERKERQHIADESLDQRQEKKMMSLFMIRTKGGMEVPFILTHNCYTSGSTNSRIPIQVHII